MWGLRAIRIGVLLGLMACVGCKSANPTPLSVGDFKSAPIDAKTEDAQPAAASKMWKRNPADWGFKDQTIAAERVHGGIY